MDIQTLTSFFMWCTIINTGVLFFLALIFLLAPNLAYQLQSRWIPVSRETFDVVFYSLYGVLQGHRAGFQRGSLDRAPHHRIGYD
jgi:hypothetical protein